MKRLLVILAAAVVAVSCCNQSTDNYFDTTTGRFYYNPDAELDTLSYSVAMNVGLGMRFHPTGMELSVESLIEGMKDEMANESVDLESMAENRDVLKRFSDERLHAYTVAKRKAMFLKDDNAELPELFDDVEFPRDMVSYSFGRDIADYIRRMGFEVNMYWVYKAMEEAMCFEGDVVEDSQLAIPQLDMRNAMSAYFKDDFRVYMADKSRAWLANVAEQRDVNMMVVDGDTLYYRVDVAGNGRRPRTERDTIGFSYDVYTQRGVLVESHDERVKTLREALDKELADTTTTNAQAKDMRIKRLEKQLDETENLEIVLGRALIKGSQYGVRNVGEGGQITLWLPASLAYGEKGNRIVGPNEGIVMNIKLKSVKYGKNDEELAAEALTPAVAPTNSKAIVKPVLPKKEDVAPKIEIKSGKKADKKAASAKPVKVVPVQK
ncbi:MAG: hypothetical protein E7146_03520 [Rikenellaceae bacterium]|nr:hypothetical protein [Rikenellaceae bacterium]